MDVNHYLEVFIDESKEHLQVLNQNLLTLENFRNTFLDNNAREPLAWTIEKKKNIPAKFRNRPVGKPAIISSLETPPIKPSNIANPNEIIPILTLKTTPTIIASINIINEINSIFTSLISTWALD